MAQDAWSSVYFRPKWFERSGRLYVWLGIRRFKRFVVWLGRALARRHYSLADRSVAAVRAFERRTRFHEVVHLVGTLGPAIALLLSDRLHPVAAALLVLVSIGNLYPFLLQRYHRVRMLRVLDRAGGARALAVPGR